MAERKLPHIVLEGLGRSSDFNGRGGGGGGGRPSDVPDRVQHAARILAELGGIQRVDAASGTYLEIIGRPGEGFAADKFNTSGLALLRVDPGEPDAGVPARATVMALREKRGIEKLSAKISDFAQVDRKPNKAGVVRPANADLAQSIDHVAEAGLRQLWRHPGRPFPETTDPTDWEVWLNPSDVDFFVATAPGFGVTVYGDRLTFPEDTVVIATGTAQNLAELVRGTGAVRAVAKPGVPVDFTDTMDAEEQVAWVEEMRERAAFTGPSAGIRSFVTVMDTGIARSHPLIEPVLAAPDRHVAMPGWDLNDNAGHGTAMAGLATYGDLRVHLEGTGAVEVSHRLESSKVIPDAGQNPHHLLGDRTRKAVDATEVGGGDRLRTFVLATTTAEDSPHSGAPTSWSAELDQLAAGKSGINAIPRLIVVSAGNIQMQHGGVHDYLSLCDHPDGEVYSPSQAWNVVTVGAMTEKNGLGGPTQGATLAAIGDLAPVSRTASWDGTWPIKPDVVVEGGNWFVQGGIQTPNSHPDLMLVTTSHSFPMRSFTDFDGTSAAAALVVRELAVLRDAYPGLWPETIRALYVGSARWNDQMWSHVPAGQRHRKGALAVLFRRYGYGKPELSRALASAANAVTLIAQDTIRPYENKRSDRKLNEMRLFELPWPSDCLRELGNTEVTLRVALSTFIAPNPSESARGRKLRYASHGLRFKLIGADETVDQFTRRVGNAAEAEVDAGIAPESGEWLFGSQRRDVGSLHIDSLRCPASELARRRHIAVHPVGGWWKDGKRIDDPEHCIARYALVVEIEAPATDTDLYTEISQRVVLPVAVEV